jgi:GMP synthase-like glutamine amidotransferase
LKIGLLKCDTVHEKFRHIAGDYSDAFINLFSAYAPEISLEIYDVEQGHYPGSLDECGGYLTTGSYRSVYDDIPWILRLRDFVAELYRNNKKFVGICFGHQMIAQALGGKCEQSERGWGIGVHTVRITRKKPWMRPKLDRYDLIVCHLDEVTELPEGSELLGTNEHCPNSMFALGDHFLGIQAHPEFTAAYAEALMLARIERIGRKKVEQARETLKREVHEKILTRWIANFLKGE